METENIYSELMEELKRGLDLENDRVGLSLEHPNLIHKSIDVSLQHTKNLTGQLTYTHIGKAVQSQQMLLFDGKMRLTVTVALGIWGSGRLSLDNARNSNDFLKK